MKGVRLLRFFPCAALVLTGLALFGSTGRDDAYITYWPADTLARTGRLLNYNGLHVEQSSSLLHTVVLAVVARISPLSVPAAGWLVGVLAGAATAMLGVVLADRIEPGSGWRAGLFVATTAYVVYWSFGGLETSLAAAVFLLALLAFDRVIRGERIDAIAVLGVLPYVLVRPEAPIVVAVLAVAVVVGGRFSRYWPSGLAWATTAGGLRALAVTGLATAPVVAFRLAYFGDYAPQPVHVKATGLKLSDGLHYLSTWLVRPDTILLAALAVVAVSRMRRSSLEGLLWLGALTQLAFVVGTGGDWMEAGRFFVPMLAVVATLAAVGVSRVRWRAPLTGLVAVAQLFGLVNVAVHDSIGRPVWADTVNDPLANSRLAVPWYESVNRVHARDALFAPKIERVVDRLHQALGHRITIASGQAGMVMYEVFQSREDDLTFIDLGRLTGDAFAHCAAGLVSTPLGEVMTLDYWFAHVDECQVPLPDVIVGLGELPARFRGQYVLADRNPSTIAVASGRLHGAPVPVAEYIAVRADLRSAAGL